ncbi:DUF6262 family protein, partial [Arthrobacter sp. MA-N2]|uniref:DUF6262 family protein n=1 Tax=Arthrobacter sp. MA-N2 TaxID=1101188 RepID=UPI0004AE871D
MKRNIQALAEATRRRRETAEKAVHSALRGARKNSKPVTFTGIANAAGVSTDFIYRHPELRSQVEALRRTRTPVRADSAELDPDTAAASSTLVRRLSQQIAELRRKHREEVAELQKALGAAHGELLSLRRQLGTKS